MQFRSKFLFEIKSIHSNMAYKILKSTMAYQLDKEIDSITPVYFYTGDPKYLVEIEDNKTYCLVKFLVSTERDIEDKIRSSLLENEEAFFNLIEEMGLSEETFLFDGKNLSPVTFEDFEMNIEKKVHANEIFCTEKGVGIIKSKDTVHIFGTAIKTEALDLSIFSLYNRLPFIQNPKNALIFHGCLISVLISGLFSGIPINEIKEEINMELSAPDVLTSYMEVKLGGAQINNSHTQRMIDSLKIDKLKEVMGVKDKIIEGEIIMKEGDTAFLSRIVDIGLNKFMSKLPSNNGKVTNVEIDIPNIGAKKIWIRSGAAFIIPDSKNPESDYNDLGYWMGLLGSENVCLAMS